MKQKLWAILLCLCLAFGSLTACGGEGNGAEGDNQNGISGETGGDDNEGGDQEDGEDDGDD